MRKLISLSILPILMASAAVAQTAGYAGQQAREIKALSAAETADLLAGRGMGLAKAAELNHDPGPMHVLELAGELSLTQAQGETVRASQSRMAAAAKPLGAEVVERERTLDQGFRDGTITAETLAAQVDRIGVLQGQLRMVHLAAHLETRAALTPKQVAIYDAARGYTASPGGQERRHGGHPPG